MRQGESTKLRLMVVDDEPDNLDLLYRTFRREFEVIKAESALQALEILEQQGEMAIIISDQRMPEMLGTEFLSKTVDRFPDTIRIVLTGYTDVEDLVEAINAGKVFKYITKPWNPDQLKGVIQQAAETYRVIKQRTYELQRALRRESLLNEVMTAIRESLDYGSMLQTIVATLARTFSAPAGLLRPVEAGQLQPEAFHYQSSAPPAGEPIPEPLLQAVLEQSQMQHPHPHQIAIPLTYQQDLLAILALSRDTDGPSWAGEDLELLQGVAEQAALALSQAKLYQRSQLQAEQMRAELAVARQIQSNLLRQSWPQLDSVKVQACCYPAREVGGDFFEVYPHPQGDVWLAVGDVSGKGVPAALFMASAISVLRRELAQENPPEPDAVMQNLNSILSEDLISTNCFITMVLARYTPSTRQLVYANAGHIYPLVWSNRAVTHSLDQPDTSEIEPNYLKVRGVPLGILPTWKASAGSLTLNSGEVLLLASDGITEASIPAGATPSTALTPGQPKHSAMLKQAGLWQLLLQHRTPLNLDHLLASIQAHNTVQEDDQTILSLEVL